MADKAHKLLRLYALYARLDLRWVLQDRAAAAFVMAAELVAGVAAAAGVGLLAVRFGGVGGLNADEVLFMLGFFELASGFTNMMFGGGNALCISRRVARGQLDHMLIQPIPLWMQLLGEGFMPASGSGGFITGLAITWIACARLGLAVTPAWLLALLLYVACHALFKIGQGYLYGAAAFYKPVACEEISAQVIDLNNLLGRYPIAGLPAWATALMTTACPAALAAYLPSLVLLGKLNRGSAPALPIVVAAAFMAAAAYFFKKGLKHYAVYGSSRYRDLGHRG